MHGGHGGRDFRRQVIQLNRCHAGVQAGDYLGQQRVKLRFGLHHHPANKEPETDSFSWLS